MTFTYSGDFRELRLIELRAPQGTCWLASNADPCIILTMWKRGVGKPTLPPESTLHVVHKKLKAVYTHLIL